MSDEDKSKVAQSLDRTTQSVSVPSLLHGDMRPENCLVTSNREIYIIDSDPIGGDSLYDLAYFSCALENQDPTLDKFMIEKYFDNSPLPEEIVQAF